MTQEEKELLLKDLCARLPYRVYVHVRYKEGEPCYGKLTPRDIQWFIDSNIEVIKPYLRPMSSMTEEEQKELEKIIDGILGYKARNYFHSEDDYKWNTLYEAIDWLNTHHFDYRGLIEKGLALEAPKGMY